jgi:hypothetical protein
MTLVIANKINNKISLSSDSRISFGSSGYIDFGIKIFSVPVKIFSPTNFDTNETTLIYDKKIGIAIIGSAINAYTVKDSIYEILQNLQYHPGHTDVSMKSISNLVFKVYNKTNLSLGLVLNKIGLCQLILTGFCPMENKNMSYEFTVDTETYPIVPKYEEILITDETNFYGSGKKLGTEISSQNPDFSPLFILREVINNQLENTVGGGLQYGEFDNENNFNIFGVEDYELNSDGSFKNYKHTLRGIELYKHEFEAEINDFHISYLFKQPFTKEIEQKSNEYFEKLERGEF